MRIALASPRIATSLDDGLRRIERLVTQAADKRAEVVCFPEAYLPGLRGQDFDTFAFERDDQERVIESVSNIAYVHSIAVILGMEMIADAGRQITAAVFGKNGELQGHQTKNQLDPTEEQFYVPGTTRTVFEAGGVKFGIAICHEGWRYPETVRWAAMRGAKIVFHPQLTGSDYTGTQLMQWGQPDAPYYEKAMLMRSIENTIYFASVNYALKFQDAATTIIGPDGRMLAYLPYGEEGVLVHDIDLDAATGALARRYAPARYAEC